MSGDGWRSGRYDAITDVPGIRVGHWTDKRGGTGCTVVLCETAVSAAVDARGGAPGTRETDVLASANLVRTCHAVLLTGGSAFGLAAADGVMRWLAEREIGFKTAARPVPIVPAAVLYDLGVGRAKAHPDSDAGYAAASRAKGGRVTQGCVGAGTGASVAKMLGGERSLKSGMGTASLLGPHGIIVGAIVANNAVGNVLDPSTGETIAGPRADEAGTFVPLPEAMDQRTAKLDALLQNTTLICVATNALLDHAQLQRVAYLAQDGLARVVLPAHTAADGDIAFAISMGTQKIPAYEATTVGLLANLAVERALVRSIRAAEGMHGLPSAAEWLDTRA